MLTSDFNIDFRLRKEKGRHRVFVGTLPTGFQPQSAGDFAPTLTAIETLIARCTTEQGVRAARAFNERQVASGVADRRWAILVHSLRGKNQQPRQQGQQQRGGSAP